MQVRGGWRGKAYCHNGSTYSTSSSSVSATILIVAVKHNTSTALLDVWPWPLALSGYASALYDTRLVHWTRLTRQAYAEHGQARPRSTRLPPNIDSAGKLGYLREERCKRSNAGFWRYRISEPRQDTYQIDSDGNQNVLETRLCQPNIARAPKIKRTNTL